jgi:hypothetical protein
MDKTAILLRGTYEINKVGRGRIRLRSFYAPVNLTLSFQLSFQGVGWEATELRQIPVSREALTPSTLEGYTDGGKRNFKLHICL